MTDHLRRLVTSRRRFLTNSAAIAGGIGASSLIGLGGVHAQTLKTVRFSEAVHTLATSISTSVCTPASSKRTGST